MKRIAIVVSSLLLAGAATGASAYSLAPTSTSFTGGGPITLTWGSTISCTAQIAGSIDANGVGHITSIQLQGGLLGSCATLSAQGLPYTLTASSATSGDIQTISVGGGPLGTPCVGINEVVTFLDAGHFKIAFDNGAQCKGAADWRVSVPLVVVP